jgi:hypothetical protein
VDSSAAIEAVRRIPPHGAVAREFARLRRDELAGSLAIAGIPLLRPHLDALIDRGLSSGEYPFAHLLAARDLAAAGVWLAEQRSYEAGDPRPLLTVEDVRRLHGLATAGQPEMRPGVWRLRVEPAASGIVAPPPWLIAKETTALVDRFRRRPDAADVPAWIAAFLARFARIRPFGAANGRAGRLAAALLLRRLDLVPLAIAPERAPIYRGAIIAAESGDAQPPADRRRRSRTARSAAHAGRPEVRRADQGGEARPPRGRRARRPRIHDAGMDRCVPQPRMTRSARKFRNSGDRRPPCHPERSRGTAPMVPIAALTRLRAGGAPLAMTGARRSS